MSQILIYHMKCAILWAVGTNLLISPPEYKHKIPPCDEYLVKKFP
jgi:hypothetical protein